MHAWRRSCACSKLVKHLISRRLPCTSLSLHPHPRLRLVTVILHRPRLRHSTIIRHHHHHHTTGIIRLITATLRHPQGMIYHALFLHLQMGWLLRLLQCQALRCKVPQCRVSSTRTSVARLIDQGRVSKLKSRSLPEVFHYSFRTESVA